MAGLGDNVGVEFDLRARMSGSATLDGQFVRVWYFDDGQSNSGFMGDRSTPSIHLEMIQGQFITVHFNNASQMDHTIHFHGMDVDQQNDGVPSTSFAVPPFGTYDYEFTAPHAGTYHYHCHVDTVIHYHRGMIGAVIVRPPNGATNLAWDGGPTFDEEVLWHLQTFDLAWKDEMVSGPATARHRPNVFLLNGKQTADALVDPFTVVNFEVGQTAYLRVVNSAYQWGRVRLGGLPFQVVASDGRPMRKVPTTDVWEIGPGERYDFLLQSEVPVSVEATVDYLDDYTGQILGQVATNINIV